MQSPTNPPQSKPTFLRRAVTTGALAVVVVCVCIVVLGVLATLRTNSSVEPIVDATEVPQEVGATVVFNVPTKTSTPRPTEGPTLAPLGDSRRNPYPVNAVVDIGDGMELTIVHVERPANEEVAAGNMFNETPEPNQEYMIVWVRIECTKPEDEKCSFFSTSLKVVGADGQVRDAASVAGIRQELEFTPEFFGGSAVEGSIPFLARTGDTETVLFFEPFLFGDPVYIALQ